METIRRRWKELALIILCIMFMGMCSKKESYRHMCEEGVKARKAACDSVGALRDSAISMYEAAAATGDSLLRANERLAGDNAALRKDIEIYREQNQLLHRKKITVILKERNGDEQQAAD